ncbi:MAG: hypothetical protein AB7P04_10665 [Bacteriovoracia bacterium]
MKKLFLVLSLFVALPALAFVGGQMGYNCPYCGMRSNYGSYAMPSFYPPNYPWWAGYGAMTYPNFYYPTAWNRGGINPTYFPGQGHVMFGKPNLYISGPAGTEVKVKVELPTENTLLAAVPAHGQMGWEATLQPATAEKPLRTAGADYRFFFYDFRSDDAKLQDEAGFCVTRQELMPRLKKILVTAGFRELEVRDFESYWSVKLPPSSKYCVYPQTQAQLDQVAPLRVTPAPTRIRRLAFVIAIKEGLVANDRKFTREPKKAWVNGDLERAVAAERATPGVEVREWSVGFTRDYSK